MTGEQKSWAIGGTLDATLIAIGAVVQDGGDVLMISFACVAVHLLGALGLVGWSLLKFKRFSAEGRWVAYGPLYMLSLLMVAYVVLLLLPSRSH
jgi:hypothetical protein